MPVLPLVIAPDPRLEVCSEAVEKVDVEAKKLMDDMLETMYENDGIGLAAVQVGVHKRILVMDLQGMDLQEEERAAMGDKLHKPYFIVNPEIVEVSQEQSVYEEGCLSFPDQRVTVSRPKSLKVKYWDYHGKEQVMHCDGLLATCIQHEIDHLNGVVLIDYVSKLKHDMILRKLRKWKKKHVQE